MLASAMRCNGDMSLRNSRRLRSTTKIGSHIMPSNSTSSWRKCPALYRDDIALPTSFICPPFTLVYPESLSRILSRYFVAKVVPAVRNQLINAVSHPTSTKYLSISSQKSMMVCRRVTTELLVILLDSFGVFTEVGRRCVCRDSCLVPATFRNSRSRACDRACSAR